MDSLFESFGGISREVLEAERQAQEIARYGAVYNKIIIITMIGLTLVFLIINKKILLKEKIAATGCMLFICTNLLLIVGNLPNIWKNTIIMRAYNQPTWWILAFIHIACIALLVICSMSLLFIINKKADTKRKSICMLIIIVVNIIILYLPAISSRIAK